MFVAQDSVFKISSRWSFCYSYQVVEMARNKPCLAKYSRQYQDQPFSSPSPYLHYLELGLDFC